MQAYEIAQQILTKTKAVPLATTLEVQVAVKPRPEVRVTVEPKIAVAPDDLGSAFLGSIFG